jgi:hypothetical protein
VARKLLSLATLLFCVNSFCATPENDLLTEAPPLAALLRQYGVYRQKLESYAVSQGFSRPYEKLATTIHELIHIHSAAHVGYWINGDEYLRPYITHSLYWPKITNNDILGHLPNSPIAYVYARNTPGNTLANCIDEINAYTHVIGFVATHEPETLSQQRTMLEGHLQMAEEFLNQIKVRDETLKPETLVVVSRIMNYARTALARYK